MASREMPSGPDKGTGAYRVATAEIIYYIPDQPDQLQTFIWQTLDIGPDFPRVTEFVSAWREETKARLHSVRVSNGDTVTPILFDRISFGITPDPVSASPDSAPQAAP